MFFWDRVGSRKSSVFFFSTSRWFKSFVSRTVYFYVTPQDTKFCFQGVLLSFLVNEFENSQYLQWSSLLNAFYLVWRNDRMLPEIPLSQSFDYVFATLIRFFVFCVLLEWTPEPRKWKHAPPSRVFARVGNVFWKRGKIQTITQFGHFSSILGEGGWKGRRV